MKNWIFCALILSSCAAEVDLKSIDYSAMLCDGNSKVWLMEREEVNGIDITESLVFSKKVVIFHSNGVFNIIPMSQIGKQNPARGYFFMDSNNKTLRFDFNDEAWKFNAEYITEDSLYFTPHAESDKKLGMKLVPFPEL